MHIFLQGARRVGKSTVVIKTLEMLAAYAPIVSGGFFTWNSNEPVSEIFMRPAAPGRERETCRIAGYDTVHGVFVDCDLTVFERTGVKLLKESAKSDIVIMDELGFLENSIHGFKQAVFDTIAGAVPVLGVLRQGRNIPWHAEIKTSSRVTLVDVTMENRGALPRELAEKLLGCLNER